MKITFWTHKKRSLQAGTLTLALALISCGSHTTTANGAENTENKANSAEQKLPEFPMTEVPVALADPAARATYLANHYWDRFDFSDPVWLEIPTENDNNATTPQSPLTAAQVLEQGFANYLQVLDYLHHPTEAEPALRALLTRAETAPKQMFTQMTDLCEKYLYDPNSPMRNEDRYIAVLQYMLACPSLDSLSKIRPKFQYEIARKNRPGSIATDFVYTTPEGNTERLGKLQSKYTLLFFYNPDCHDCGRVKTHIADSPSFAMPGLEVLAVYADKNEALWRTHLPEMPKNWTVGRDAAQAITNKTLYDLRAIPCLYLLDKDKRVILKDAPVESIEQYLTELNAK